MIKKHNLTPEDQCAQSGKHGNEGSMLKLLHCNINSAMHAPHAHAAVSAELKDVFDLAQQAVASMSVRSMGVSARIATMFLLCWYLTLPSFFGVIKVGKPHSVSLTGDNTPMATK